MVDRGSAPRRGSWAAHELARSAGAANGGRRRRPRAGAGGGPRRSRSRGEGAALRELGEHPVPRRPRRLRVQRGVVARRASAAGRSAGRSRPARGGPVPCRSRTRPPRPRPRRCRRRAVRFRYSSSSSALLKRRSSCKARKASRSFERQGARPRGGHAGDLHRDGRGARDHLAGLQVGPRRARHRRRIDPAVAPESAGPPRRPGPAAAPGGSSSSRTGNRHRSSGRQEEAQRLARTVRDHRRRRPVEVLPGKGEEQVERPEREPGGERQRDQTCAEGQLPGAAARLAALSGSGASPSRYSRCLTSIVAALPGAGERRVVHRLGVRRRQAELAGRHRADQGVDRHPAAVRRQVGEDQDAVVAQVEIGRIEVGVGHPGQRLRCWRAEGSRPRGPRAAG